MKNKQRDYLDDLKIGFFALNKRFVKSIFAIIGTIAIFAVVIYIKGV